MIRGQSGEGCQPEPLQHHSPQFDLPTRNSPRLATVLQKTQKSLRGTTPQALFSNHLSYNSTTFTGGVPNRIQETFRGEGFRDKMTYPRINQFILYLIDHTGNDNDRRLDLF